jgi:hypothetical protein
MRLISKNHVFIPSISQEELRELAEFNREPNKTKFTQLYRERMAGLQVRYNVGLEKSCGLWVCMPPPKKPWHRKIFDYVSKFIFTRDKY